MWVEVFGKEIDEADEGVNILGFCEYFGFLLKSCRELSRFLVL